MVNWKLFVRQAIMIDHEIQQIGKRWLVSHAGSSAQPVT
jgi:hypothetical protein